MEEYSTDFRVIMLNGLKELHEFLTSNRIPYFVIGGTLLGAIRHKGFIPWDDDIDIGIPRPEYDKLLEKIMDYNKNHIDFKFHHYTLDKQYPHLFLKFVSNKWELREKGFKRYKSGVYIDIFPLDGVKENSLKEYQRIKKLVKLHTLKMIDLSYLGIRNKGLKILTTFISTTLIRRKLEQRLRSNDIRDCKWFCNYLGAWGRKEVMSKTIINQSCTYNFENQIVFGPCDFDSYLKNLYGDYMIMPPISKRKSHHNFILIKKKEEF